VIEKDLEHFLQAQCLRAAVDERNGVDTKGIFKRGEPVEMLKNSFWPEPGLNTNNNFQAILPVREISDIRNSLNFLGIDTVANLFNHAFWADQVGEFGNDQT